MNRIGAVLVLLTVLVGGCQSKSGSDADIVTDAHGESVKPTYRIDIDPRWAKSTFAMAAAAKRGCSTEAWQDCAIGHLVKALPYGASMAPYCRGLKDFADAFYCITMGATGAEVVKIAGLGDPDQFIRDHGNAQADTASEAAKSLANTIMEKCTSASVPKGCAPTEAASRLGSSKTSLADCVGFDDWKATSCLFIGRMSELLDKATSGV
jgi:hypothetical protein